MEYYDLKKHWRKVKRHLDHPEVQKFSFGTLTGSHGGDGVRSSNLGCCRVTSKPAIGSSSTKADAQPSGATPNTQLAIGW